MDGVDKSCEALSDTQWLLVGPVPIQIIATHFQKHYSGFMKC